MFITKTTRAPSFHWKTVRTVQLNAPVPLTWICNFYLTDQIEKGNIEVHYCPTNKMVANCHSKPLQGKPFNFLREQLLGHDISLIPFPV